MLSSKGPEQDQKTRIPTPRLLFIYYITVTSLQLAHSLSLLRAAFSREGVPVPAAHHANDDSQARTRPDCCAHHTCFIKLSQLPAQALPTTSRFCCQVIFPSPATPHTIVTCSVYKTRTSHLLLGLPLEANTHTNALQK